MKMDNSFEITRCPYCGSLSLTACYDDSGNKKAAKAMFFFSGLVGLAIGAAQAAKKTQVFWQCNNCNSVFSDTQN